MHHLLPVFPSLINSVILAAVYEIFANIYCTALIAVVIAAAGAASMITY